MATGLRRLHVSRPPTPSNHGESETWVPWALFFASCPLKATQGTSPLPPRSTCPLGRVPGHRPISAPREEQLLGPRSCPKASARGCSHAEGVSHERLSLPRPRWPSHTPSLLPSIPPPPSPGFFLPLLSLTRTPTAPQDTTPTGAAHKASAPRRPGSPGLWSARERGSRSRKQRQDWTRAGQAVWDGSQGLGSQGAPQRSSQSACPALRLGRIPSSLSQIPSSCRPNTPPRKKLSRQHPTHMAVTAGA